MATIISLQEAFRLQSNKKTFILNNKRVRGGNWNLEVRTFFREFGTSYSQNAMPIDLDFFISNKDSEFECTNPPQFFKTRSGRLFVVANYEPKL